MNKIPCGGFYYDENLFDFHTNPEGHKVLTKRINPIQLGERIYQIDYESYNYEDALSYMENHNIDKGMCTSFVELYSNIAARNFDWYYGEEPTFVIRTPHKYGRYATVGVAHGIGDLVNDVVLKQEKSEYYYMLPMFTDDCVNEMGVFCSLNVVPTGDKGHTTGTNPGAKELCQLMIPRYVCDYAATATEALELLLNCNIWSVAKGTGVEVHALIADKYSYNTVTGEDIGGYAYIVEFVDNHMVVYGASDREDVPEWINDMPEFMPYFGVVSITNFYIDGWNISELEDPSSAIVTTKWKGYTDEQIQESGLTPHAEGLERMALLYSMLNEGYYPEDFDSCAELLYELRYTKTYTMFEDASEEDYWLSEFVAGDRTIYSEIDSFDTIVDQALEEFDNRERNKKTWYTAHSSRYSLDKDSDNPALRVFVEEDFDNYYDINFIGKEKEEEEEKEEIEEWFVFDATKWDSSTKEWTELPDNIYNLYELWLIYRDILPEYMFRELLMKKVRLKIPNRHGYYYSVPNSASGDSHPQGQGFDDAIILSFSTPLVVDGSPEGFIAEDLGIGLEDGELKVIMDYIFAPD